MNDKALATRDITPSTWQMVMAIAPVIHESHLFGTFSVSQAAAIMLKSIELGLPLTAGFELIHVVQGKPTLSPRGALALIQQSGLLEECVIQDEPDRCVVTMKRKNGPRYTASFGLDDAKRAKLIKPDSAWASYPANLCRWRAVGFCADVLFADITGGLRRADELGAPVNEAGDVIDGEWSTLPTNGAVVAEPSVASRLAELVEQYDADLILTIMSGRLPTTLEEVEFCRERLADGFGTIEQVAPEERPGAVPAEAVP